MSSSAANPPAAPTSSGGVDESRSTVPRLRRSIVIGVVAVLVAAVGAFVVDTVLAARSEARLSHSLQASPRLQFAPEVTLGGFPFVSHARRDEFSSLTITARGVPLPRAGSRLCTSAQCWAELGANATGVSSSGDAWSIAPGDTLSLDAVTAYAKLDSVNLGRLLDITDLSVNTPAPEDRAGGGGPGDGLLERTSGVMLTGTVALPPDAASTPSASSYRGAKMRVSVSVDLAVRGNALVIIATDFYTGPEEHASGDVPAQYRTAVLKRFSGVVGYPALPWGISPTSATSAGSDVLIRGSATLRHVRVDKF